jgi:hypothetical protein
MINATQKYSTGAHQQPLLKKNLITPVHSMRPTLSYFISTVHQS